MERGVLILAVAMALLALGSLYDFLAVLRVRLRVWVLANTCSSVVIACALFLLSGSMRLACAAGGMMMTYGVAGAFAFGVRRHRRILVPQVMHLGMVILAMALLLAASSRAEILAWAGGVFVAMLLKPLQDRFLRRSRSTQALWDDPILGPVLDRLVGPREAVQ